MEIRCTRYAGCERPGTKWEKVWLQRFRFIGAFLRVCNKHLCALALPE